MQRFGLILITYILTTVGAVAWAGVNDGLIAHWSFDACNFQDQSGSGFDDGAAPEQAPECLAGAEGNALDFAGTNAHYVRIPDVPVAANQHSYAFWFRPATALNAGSPRQDLIYADVPVVVSGNGRPHITLNHDGDGKIGFHAQIIPSDGSPPTSYNDIKSDTDTWQADRWYHVAFTWNGSRFRVYVDGNLERTITKPSGTSHTYTGLVLAIRGDLQFPFDGSLDEIRLYDRVLSGAEVQTLATFAPGPSFPLTVSTAGTGTGSVFSTPTAEIACGTAGSDCTQSYASGTSVTLTAVATPDSFFTGWSGGGCESAGTAPCTVPINQAQFVSATFLPGLTLSVTVVGDGVVTSNPAGIDCGTTCSAGFSAGTVVTLTATPVTGASFAGWQGACSGFGPCIVTMNTDNAVTAIFTSGFFPLSVTNTLGTGTGTVTSSPPGIDCGVDCDELYPSGTLVTLTPTPGIDSFFFQWGGGDCSGTDPCTLTMDQARSADAVFALIQTRLTVVKDGTGSGTVSSDPPGINCGPDCGNNYNVNTVVTLTATPADADTVFIGWIGGGCSGVDACVVTMTEDLTVTATFERLSTLNIIKDGDGTGSVVSDLPGIDCGEDCSEVYTGATVITLTATPTAGSAFTGWSDPGCPGTGPCVVTLPEGRDITATFKLLFLLDVTKAGTGDGTVTSDLPGINCGADCSETYVSGSNITLTASANPDSIFTGWSAAECPGTDSCTITLASALTVTATFERLYTLSVSSSGDGAGSIASAPAGITCGADCSEIYVSMTAVTLTATPEAGSAFTGWSDASCPGTAPCVVLMTESRTISATFKRLFSLSVTQVNTGGGRGTISSAPAGIACGDNCTAVFTSDTTVTLLAAPEPDSLFISWSGDCQGSGACVLALSEDRTVTARFENPPPIADAGADQSVDEGILVTLNGSQSTDLNDTPSYSWMQTGGDAVTLSDTSAAQPTFTSPGVDANGTVLLFDLSVTDSRGLFATDQVQVDVLDTNIPPLADAGPDQFVEENVQVMLDGANSSDSDGGIESFVWLQMAGPPVSLSDPTSQQPVFNAPVVGLSTGFQPGDTLPGFVLRQGAAGSIADVAARGAYSNGQWTVMFTRALTTIDPDADVQFDLSDAANLYAFSIAYLDNTGAAPPRSAAAAVMWTQDTTPYTLGNATSGADLQAHRETPLDCSAFTGTPLVTTPTDPDHVPSLTLQAAYDDINFYLCVHAPDPNGVADEQPEHWEFIGPESTDWERKPNTVNVMGGTPNAFDEDRIAIWWNINAQDFTTEGCFALCHDQRMQSRNPDGRADLWHWKAGTTNLAGLAQDQGLSADPLLCPEHPCRQSDSATEAIAMSNARLLDAMMLPAFIAADGPGVSVRALFADDVPIDCPDCALAQSAAVFDDMLEFELTVTDDGGLTASDHVAVQVVEAGGNDTDADGVSNAVEDQAPNNGDGNSDGVADRRQAHVASLPNRVDGTYITIESPSGSVLVDVRSIPNPSPGNAPSNTAFPLGFFTFILQDLTPGDAATITLYLPPGTAPSTYYKFGPTPDNPSPHWYEFLFDTVTGAEFAGNRVVLHLQDGQRGDDDLTENGEIMDPGAVAMTTTQPPPTTGGGGGGGGCAMTPGARGDPTLLAALSLILVYLGWRHTRRCQLSTLSGKEV